MLYNNAVLCTISTDPFKPFLHPGEQADPGAVVLQLLPGEKHLALSLFLHKKHISQILIHIVAAGQTI